MYILINMNSDYQICRTCRTCLAQFWNVRQRVQALPDILSSDGQCGGNVWQRKQRLPDIFKWHCFTNYWCPCPAVNQNVWQSIECLPDILSGMSKIILTITDMNVFYLFAPGIWLVFVVYYKMVSNVYPFSLPILLPLIRTYTMHLVKILCYASFARER